MDTCASPARRAIVIGLDGASMEIVKHMVERGHAPNLGQLIVSGCHREMLGVLPTLTPPGWTTMMTGCWPGSHEVTISTSGLVGRPLDETVSGINTGLCQREYLWNAAERAEKLPILLKFEMSWPPTIRSGIQIEGCGPGHQQPCPDSRLPLLLERAGGRRAVLTRLAVRRSLRPAVR